MYLWLPPLALESKANITEWKGHERPGFWYNLPKKRKAAEVTEWPWCVTAHPLLPASPSEMEEDQLYEPQ